MIKTRYYGRRRGIHTRKRTVNRGEARYWRGKIYFKFIKASRLGHTTSRHNQGAFHQRFYDGPLRDQGSQRKWSRTQRISKGRIGRFGVVTHKNNNTKATSREEQVDPRLYLSDLNVEARRDDASFVETTVQLYDNFA